MKKVINKKIDDVIAMIDTDALACECRLEKHLSLIVVRTRNRVRFNLIKWDWKTKKYMVVQFMDITLSKNITESIEMGVSLILNDYYSKN